jgi:hypothetical protein
MMPVATEFENLRFRSTPFQNCIMVSLGVGSIVVGLHEAGKGVIEDGNN